jgi:GT2 family glycosyltransferase
MPQTFMIATPTLDGNVKTATALGWVELTAAIHRQGDRVTFALPRSPLITYSRNYCARQAVEQKVDYLLFWDSDVAVARPRDFLYLLRDRLEQHGAWVAAAPYRFKSPGPPTYPVGRDTGSFANPEYLPVRFGETFEVEYVTTGLMLIPRWVLERVPRPWFHVEDDPATLNVIPEDYYFCRKVRAAGGKLLCVGEVATVHFGEMPYPFPPEAE